MNKCLFFLFYFCLKYEFLGTFKIFKFELTDGVDDAAISVPGAIQAGQVSDGLLSQRVL